MVKRASFISCLPTLAQKIRDRLTISEWFLLDLFMALVTALITDSEKEEGFEYGSRLQQIGVIMYVNTGHKTER